MKRRILVALLGLYAASPLAPAQEPFEERPTTPLWQVVLGIAAEEGFSAEVEGIVENLRSNCLGRRPPTTHRRVVDMLANPWTVPAHSRDLRDLLVAPLAERQESRFEALVQGIGDWLDHADPTEEDDEQDSFVELEELWAEIQDPTVVEGELLERLSEFMGLAHDLLAEPWMEIDPSLRDVLFQESSAASEAWYRGHFPEQPDEEAQADAEVLDRYRPALLRADLPRILRVAGILVRLLEDDFLNTLGKRLAKTPKDRDRPEGFSGDIVAVVGDTAATRVVLGGRGKTTYRQPAALIIDLSGNDTYHRAAVVDQPDALASVVLDLAGNDVYQAEGPGPVWAVGGVALLWDRKGKDRYVSTRHAQGASAAGFSLLVDGEGDDVYTAEDYAQGFSLCGVGLLFDLEGDDEYSAWANAQGAGIGHGFSALVDARGDDTYLADLHWPDVYGNSGPEIYHGASQGYCTGMRGVVPEIAGGFAALIDVTGKDRYQAGNFSQGGGYYFSFGLQYDGEGDDENHGSRYAQGFGVHQAIGVRWDGKGNDYYHTRSVAHCGSAWDQGVGFLIEEAGNDVYECGGLALGAAAQTAIAFLVDHDGKDRYQSSGGKDTQGGTGGSDYHDLPSLGVFLDLGGDRDDYSKKERENNSLASGRWNWIFRDGREKEPTEILSRLPRRKP